uniref:HTH psq-type domain-containing protein n=1 Tax=Haplochromis burtoni TaxID=8153 RepID=A0A3Q3BZD9_HAPBU
MPSILERASNDVRNQGKSTRSVAKLYGICHVTLHRFCKERKKVEEQGSMELPCVGYHSGKKVFTDEQEKELTEYLMRVKELAYQLAVKHGCKYPKSWDKFSRAGPDWFSAYMKRNPTLSIRSAEATSLARATSFNQHNVAIQSGTHEFLRVTEPPLLHDINPQFQNMIKEFSFASGW